jgi:hypothetical protein
VHRGWLIAALIAAPLSVVIFFGFQTGSCQDSSNPAASSCTQGPEPFAILLGVAGAVFVVYALIRAFHRQ